MKDILFCFRGRLILKQTYLFWQSYDHKSRGEGTPGTSLVFDLTNLDVNQSQIEPCRFELCHKGWYDIQIYITYI